MAASKERQDTRRLDPAADPVSTEVQTRFGDMDALRHLNNVALAGIYDDARVRFGATIDLTASRDRGHRIVVGEVTIRYLAEGRYPDPVTATAGVSRIGSSSYTLAQALFQDGRCISTCDTVFVYIKPDEGRSRPLPDSLRQVLAAHALQGAELAPSVTSGET